MSINRLRYLYLLVAALAAACGDSPGPSGNAPAGEPHVEQIRYANSLGGYRALVHVPASYDPQRPLPLVVNVHGCGRTAEQQVTGTLYGELANRESFIVIFPDYDGAATAAHPLGCWRFYEPAEWQRGVGDADGIAELTRLAMSWWSVDPERVYIVGSSSGALMTSIMGASYPDLYAAIGIMAGGPYASTIADAFQPIGPMLSHPQLQAQLAALAMGPNARVVPVLEMHGDQDTVIYPQNGVNAVQQWLMTNNLVVSGTTSGPFPLMPTSSRVEPNPGGYPYEVDDYRDTGGCLIVRHVRIQGHDHGWPGATDDATVPPAIDPGTPSGTEMSWEFFKRYRKSGSAWPCAAATPATPQ
ncbi:MAG TPA: PHB depolymerase family esterase [Solimonas sp.]|nr:PHB depolymerase family esterase [Solimonas sp.]